MTGIQLKKWREGANKTLTEMAELLRVSSPNTIKNWEESVEIGGPAGLLLDYLIDGIPPFGKVGEAAERLHSAAWRVEMTLEAWEKLEALRIAEGYTSMTDFIASLVVQEIDADERQRGGGTPESGIALLADAPSTEPVPARKGVTYPAKGKGSAKP